MRIGCVWVPGFFCGPVGGDGSDGEASQKTCGYFAIHEQWEANMQLLTHTCYMEMLSGLCRVMER